MILQTDKRFGIKQIKRFACYYFDILFFDVKYTGLELSIGKIEAIYHALIFHKWMNKNCWIKDPKKIFSFLGLEVDYHKEDANYICKANEFEIPKYVWQRAGKKDWPHFVCGTGTFEEVAYDSYGCSNAVKYGTLWNKRIFQLL